MPILPRSFYHRSAVDVAQDLLGKELLYRTPSGTCGGIIVETEAYTGPDDQAAHSRNGTRTKRTEVMYGAGGIAYIYLIYGIYWCLNVVVDAVDNPSAVLIRALQPTRGFPLMRRRRGLGLNSNQHLLTSGPGRLTQALRVTGTLNGAPLWKGPLTIQSSPIGTKIVAAQPIISTTRIGVEYSGSWAEKPWRFLLQNNNYVSVGISKNPNRPNSK